MNKREKANDKLLKAVAEFITANGGLVMVAGGIQIETVHDDEFRFKVIIKCTGNPPQTSKDSNASRDKK